LTTPQQLLQETEQQLALYDGDERQTIARWLCEDIVGLKKSDFLSNQAFEHKTETQLNAAIKRLNNAEPIQYVLGEAEFFGLKFKVNPAVLIPRPETEELIEMVLSKVDKTQANSILDIGTGSGCIAITLAKKLPKAMVSAWDISDEALAVAQQNAVLNQVEVDFKKVDALSPTQANGQFDVIVSNPPYVKASEAATMRANVLAFEPHLALFVPDNNALVFYEAIVKIAQKNLQPNGWLCFEINEALGQETAQLLIRQGFTAIEIKKDYFGVDRMVVGQKVGVK
jgi:release factor glutamine methyltransferase